jgi:hypothetical protein
MLSSNSGKLSLKVSTTVLLLFITAASISYFSFRNFLKIDVCLDSGGAWNDKKQICDINIEREISNHLWTNHTDSLVINVPETNTVAILNDAIALEDADYFKGEYLKIHSPDIIEKGAVFYDDRKITIISKVAPDNNTKLYYATTFSVSNQGSGFFTYAGLFLYDRTKQKSIHMDSYFLGDRIKEVKITDEIQAIKISFYRHTTTQSFSEYPAEKQTINLSVTDNGTKFQFYKGIHPSWDKNQDHINDCENDGTCDHTTDYSKAREQL